MESLRDNELGAALRHDGYAVVSGFLTPAEVAELTDVFRRCESPLHAQAFGASIQSSDLSYRAAVDRGIAAVLAPRIDELLEGYRFCFSNFLVKEPQRGSGMGEVPLHQDPSFVVESRYESIGLWCPLVDTDEENGCMHVVPGSHVPTEPRAFGIAHAYRGAEPPRMRAVPMRAGDGMVFSQKLFHASPPNRSTAKRIAVGALAVPREAQLYCYYVDGASAAKMEVFAVDDAFYTSCPYGTRPAGVPRVGLVERAAR